MALRILRGKGATASVARPKGTAKAEIRADFDLREEQGKVKFLVHRKKAGMWYRVRGYDEQSGVLRLSTVHDKGTVPSQASKAMSDNYVLVAEPTGATAPSAAAIAKVQKP